MAIFCNKKKIFHSVQSSRLYMVQLYNLMAPNTRLKTLQVQRAIANSILKLKLLLLYASTKKFCCDNVTIDVSSETLKPDDA